MNTLRYFFPFPSFQLLPIPASHFFPACLVHTTHMFPFMFPFTLNSPFLAKAWRRGRLSSVTLCTKFDLILLFHDSTSYWALINHAKIKIVCLSVWLAPVVQRVDNASQWTNYYPVDNFLTTWVSTTFMNENKLVIVKPLSNSKTIIQRLNRWSQLLDSNLSRGQS